MYFSDWLENEQPMTYEQPLYFGCKGDAGHFVWTQDGQRLWRSGAGGASLFLMQNDGRLAPKETRDQGKAVVHHYPEFTVVAFWDNSVDTRPGSNSMFLLPPGLSANQAIESAKQSFPNIFSRLKFNVELLREESH